MVLSDGDSTSGGALPLWHVTLTLAGEPLDAEALREGLDRLVFERPFMLSVRYDCNRAELRYWDEAEDVDDAAALALRLWGEHRLSCHLPAWRVVGLEVLDRDTVRARGAGRLANPLVAARVAPF
jgi:hypothetical protein